MDSCLLLLGGQERGGRFVQDVHRDRGLSASLSLCVCTSVKALPCLQSFFSHVMLDLIILNRKGKYGLSPKSTQIR